ncbi:hypothetical protein Q8F55_002771 [Vanrija albida]|uniref:Uncharacterized protein n=1 Tax=Vanrija albida TaxID=181172 RepID=A0ABR3QAQ1_9TREE
MAENLPLAAIDSVDAQLAALGADHERLDGNFRSGWTRMVAYMRSVHLSQQRQEQDLGAMALFENKAAWHVHAMRDSQEEAHATLKRFVDAVEIGALAPVGLPTANANDPAPLSPVIQVNTAQVRSPTILANTLSIASVVGHIEDALADEATAVTTPRARAATIHEEEGEGEGQHENHGHEADHDGASTIAQPPRPRTASLPAAFEKMFRTNSLSGDRVTPAHFCWAWSNNRCDDLVCPRGLFHGCHSCYKRGKPFDHRWCMGTWRN